MRNLQATILGALVLLGAADEKAAKANRATVPESDWPYTYYLSTSHLQGEALDDTQTALRLMVASSSLQPVIERCLPQPIAESTSLYRIDLNDLHWSYKAWKATVSSNPYGVDFPLVLRADWLLMQLSDSHNSDAYYALLFGAVPKTRGEFLKLLSVDASVQHRFGVIEGNSGVNLQGTRWIESRPAARGYAWGTRDSVKLTYSHDPLEHPLGDFRHDGEEWIVGVPKLSAATGKRGALQVYGLFNGGGKTVRRAPVDLVRDSTRFRGKDEIVAPGSCVQCHSTGLNDFTENALRSLIAAGVEVYATKDRQEQLERFHLSELGVELRRNREDYATAVEAVTGREPAEAAAAFKRAVEAYDRNLSPADCARELGITENTLRLALGWASAREQLSARVTGLAHGRSVRRTIWEEQYLTVKQYVNEWGKTQ